DRYLLCSATVEDQVKVAFNLSWENIAILENNKIFHDVNAPRISENINKELRPYINIAGHMGEVVIQLINRPPSEIKLKYHGELAIDDTSMLTRSFVSSIRKPHLGANVNIINALYLLQ